MPRNAKALTDAITNLSGISQRYATDTATFHDHTSELLATEQKHLEELRKRLQSGEDSAELAEEYVDCISKVSALYEHLGALSDDVDENRKWRGDTKSA